MCLGKTYWWYYALRRRIGDKKPILLYQGENSYLFCSAGVLVVPTSQGFRFNSRMWTLIDSVNASTGFPENMNTLVANIFPIYITSPQQKRWSSAVQFWSVHRVIMNPWTRAEMEYASVKSIHDLLYVKPSFHLVQSTYTHKKNYPTCSKNMTFLGRPHVSVSILPMLPITSNPALSRSRKCTT